MGFNLTIDLHSLAAKGVCLWLDSSSVSTTVTDTYKSAYNKYMDSVGIVSKNKKILPNGIEDQSYGSIAIYNSSPVSLAKAVKNEAELRGMCGPHLSSPCIILDLAGE